MVLPGKSKGNQHFGFCESNDVLEAVEVWLPRAAAAKSHAEVVHVSGLLRGLSV